MKQTDQMLQQVESAQGSINPAELSEDQLTQLKGKEEELLKCKNE